MNTQGWIRGLMAKNMEDGKFLEHVTECLSGEFEMPAEIIRNADVYLIKLGNYNLTLSKYEVNEKRSRGPYTLDRVVLDRLKENGLEFDQRRSQYIRYCYGIFDNI